MKTKHAAIIAGLFLLLLLGYAIISSGPPKYFDSKSPVMYFYSDTCSHCIAMKPILKELGDEGFRLNPINIVTGQALFTQYSVLGTPTFIGQNNSRIEGETDKETLRTFLLSNGAKLA